MHVILLASEAYVVLWKMKMKLDKSAAITLIVYNLGFFLYTISWILYLVTGDTPDDPTGSVWIQIMFEMATIMIWLVLYFFIYELKFV